MRDRRGGCFHQRYAFCQFACLRALEERISEEQLQNLQHISQGWAFLRRSFLPNRCGKSRWFSGNAGAKTGAAGRIRYRLPALQAAKQQHKPVIELEGAENRLPCCSSSLTKDWRCWTIR